MNFDKKEINLTIAEAIGEAPGANFFDEEGPNQQRFLMWARPRLHNVDAEVFEHFCESYGELIASVSLLGLMNRWSNNHT